MVEEYRSYKREIIKATTKINKNHKTEKINEQTEKINKKLFKYKYGKLSLLSNKPLRLSALGSP